MKLKTSVIVCLVLFSACVKDKPQVQNTQAVNLTVSKKVYIINEGNFQTANASVSLYEPASGQHVENIYHSVNQSSPGDVAQSLTHINANFYLVMNNSGKIIVCDEKFKKLSEIKNLQSPRYILPVSNQKAYVSDLYANAIHVVDLNTNSKTGSIACNGWTEQMLLIYNKVFVCNPRSKYVYVINSITDQKTDSVAVGINASSLVLDKYDKVWVLSSGDKLKNELPRLSRINPVTLQIEKTLEFKQDRSVSGLCLNRGKDTLYYLSGGVYRMPVSSNELPETEFLSGQNKNYYGLGVNANDYTVYVADALDYIQRSNVYIYNSKGELLKDFKAGINTNGFYFE